MKIFPPPFFFFLGGSEDEVAFAGTVSISWKCVRKIFLYIYGCRVFYCLSSLCYLKQFIVASQIKIYWIYTWVLTLSMNALMYVYKIYTYIYQIRIVDVLLPISQICSLVILLSNFFPPFLPLLYIWLAFLHPVLKRDLCINP